MGLFLLESGIGSAVHEGLDLHSVGWVSNEEWELLSHLEFGEAILTVEVAPELILERLSSQNGDWDLLHTNSFHDSVGGEEGLVVLQVWSQALLGVAVSGEGDVMLRTDEFLGGVSILESAFTVSSSTIDGVLETVVSVVFPDSLEMWLGRDLLTHFMWELEVLHFDDLWSKLVKGLILSFVLESTLFSGGVDTENNVLILICVSEGVNNFLWVIKMAVVSQPVWLSDLIVEKSGGSTFTPLLKSEPLDDVWLLSFTPELLWSPLRVEISHGVIPSLSGISIDLPTISLFRGSPVWYSETLEESSWSSVEGDISDSFEKGLWVEVLGINVMHDIWFLMELVHIEVLDSNSYIIINLKLEIAIGSSKSVQRATSAQNETYRFLLPSQRGICK